MKRYRKLLLVTFSLALFMIAYSSIKGYTVESEKVDVFASGDKNILEVIDVYGGTTFDPNLEIQVNDYSIFDTKTKLDIIEEGNNIFVTWSNSNFGGYYDLSISIANDDKWNITNKKIIDSSNFTSWKSFGTYVLGVKNNGKIFNPNKEISVSRLDKSGNLIDKEILLDASSLYNVNIIPSTIGPIIVNREDSHSKYSTTYQVTPLENEIVEKQNFTIKNFPEGGIDQPLFIDFNNNKLYGMGKVSEGLLQINLNNGEPLYDESGAEKAAIIDDPVYFNIDKKGNLEILSNDDQYLRKYTLDQSHNIMEDKILKERNDNITVSNNQIHYWEFGLYKNRPSLKLTKFKF